MHDQVEEIYRVLPMPISVREVLRGDALREAISADHEREHLKRALRGELADITRREVLLGDRLASRLLEPETYALAADSLASEREEIERKLTSAAERTPDVDVRGARTVWELHSRLAPGMQDRLLRMVFRSIRLGTSGIVGYVLRQPFRALQDDRTTSLRRVA